MRRIYIIAIIFCFASLTIYAQNVANYKAIFNQIEGTCNKDNGQLWGINLYAPLLFIDREDRTIWSNQQDKHGNFILDEGVYQGKYPEEKIIANSTTDLYDQKWSMVAVPLPEDNVELLSLVCHEMFHYWQDSLKLTPSLRTYNNSHMDDRDARVLLKLEWNALLAACSATDEAIKKSNITDGLAFRVYRQQIYKEVYPHETAFEIHEGLPQYTGLRLAVRNDADYVNAMKNHLDDYMEKDMLVRSFAYMSGEIYGYLLDDISDSWRKEVNGDSDLGLLLKQYCHITLPENLKEHCEAVQNNYSGKEICESENHRDLKKKEEKEALMTLFSENVIKLPLVKMNIGFNPSQIIPLEGLGTIYKNARIVDEWGTLETLDEGTILITDDWKWVLVPYADQIAIHDNVQETPFCKLTYNK